MIRKKITNPLILAPGLVHPRAVRQHGLFGLPYVRQHMVADDRWSPTSLSEQFRGMADLLAKRLLVERLQYKRHNKQVIAESRSLKRQIRDGRKKLNNVLYGASRQKVRNELMHHRDMQRLYHKLPPDIVSFNINQRTFVIRKERDRLAFRLQQLKEQYKEKLLMRAELENRMRFQNDYIIEEDLKARKYLKKIEKSDVRLQAVKTINSAYLKMAQILQHDSIFYEPILRSLSKDIEDQGAFTKHVLSLGAPALAKFREIGDEYKILEEKSRMSLRDILNEMAHYGREDLAKRFSGIPRMRKSTIPIDFREPRKRFMRETASMRNLKKQLAAIEQSIKRVQTATLCSRVSDIFPRIKEGLEHNVILKKIVGKYDVGYSAIHTRKRRSEVLAGVLLHNHSEEDAARLERIKQLRKEIEEEDLKERDTIQAIKNRSDAILMIRFGLWNISEILKYVDRPHRLTRVEYPVSYLKLPLLKFEILTMRACPPEQYEIRTDALTRNIKIKIHKLMKVFKNRFTHEQVRAYTKRFAELFTITMINTNDDEGSSTLLLRPATTTLYDSDDDDENLTKDAKTGVPNRRVIKNESARIVDDELKRDD